MGKSLKVHDYCSVYFYFQLLATIILSQLRFHHGNFNDCHSVVSGAYECLLDFISDHTPIVLKSVCEALRICLPVLLVSTQPTKGTYVKY